MPFWGTECLAPSGFPCQVLTVASVPRNRRSVTLVAWCPPSVDSLGLLHPPHRRPSSQHWAFAAAYHRGALSDCLCAGPARTASAPFQERLADCGLHGMPPSGGGGLSSDPPFTRSPGLMRHAASLRARGPNPAAEATVFTDRCPTLGPARIGPGRRPDRCRCCSRTGRLPWSPAAYPRVGPGRMTVSDRTSPGSAPHRKGAAVELSVPPCASLVTVSPVSTGCPAQVERHFVRIEGLEPSRPSPPGQLLHQSSWIRMIQLWSGRREPPSPGSSRWAAPVVDPRMRGYPRGGPFSTRLLGLPLRTSKDDGA